MIIEIKNFPVYTAIGHYNYEKAQTSQVIFDLSCSYSRKSLKDELVHTLDYDNILKTIIHTVESKPHIDLLETLVRKVGDTLIKKFSLITELEIKATKPGVRSKLNRGCSIYVREKFTRKKSK
jgi:FolB domain-containing protein